MFHHLQYFIGFCFGFLTSLACRLSSMRKVCSFPSRFERLLQSMKHFASRSLNVYGFTSVDGCIGLNNNFTTVLCQAGGEDGGQDRGSRKRDWNCISEDFLWRKSSRHNWIFSCFSVHFSSTRIRTIKDGINEKRSSSSWIPNWSEHFLIKTHRRQQQTKGFCNIKCNWAFLTLIGNYLVVRGRKSLANKAIILLELPFRNESGFIWIKND